MYVFIVNNNCYNKLDTENTIVIYCKVNRKMRMEKKGNNIYGFKKQHHTIYNTFSL